MNVWRRLAATLAPAAVLAVRGAATVVAMRGRGNAHGRAPARIDIMAVDSELSAPK